MVKVVISLQLRHAASGDYYCESCKVAATVFCLAESSVVASYMKTSNRERKAILLKI